ncbi:MAG: RNA polymerase sigma-70 factor [Chlorobi bacterium]|nr:RNA polymerase sigma-70 factor [Chlorobiota bacterium]
MTKYIKKIEERGLFKKVQNGDVKSLEVLFDRYYNVLCNFAYLFLKDEECAKEIVSELFINIWQKRQDIVIRESLKSYLYKSVKNAVISRKRKKTESLKEDIDFKTPDFITPETLLLQKEFEDKVKELFAELPLKSGLVFRMKRIDGLRYKEISKVLNISEKTVENHMGNAIKKIKAILDKHPELADYFKR